ncbi:expressed protein [Phakopsora pachyrhizi]|uniref:Expressed protein n=1 Tax=Phakopsora pachyrhizi TaxID=170000 RepID=A0AAV0ADU0_PHAPC|nr:expressed protein [Phakopsora pachyrhizi]
MLFLPFGVFLLPFHCWNLILGQFFELFLVLLIHTLNQSFLNNQEGTVTPVADSELYKEQGQNDLPRIFILIPHQHWGPLTSGPKNLDSHSDGQSPHQSSR